MDLIRRWYDGYIFGNTEVFCPWDVVSYVSAILYDEEEEPQIFWANTSSNAILDDFVNHRKIDACEKFEILRNGIFTSRGFAPGSNDEAGLGRPDLRVKDRGKRSVLLMEFKRSKQEKDLDADCDEAIDQIFDKGYDKALPEGYEQQIIYGIAFYAKRAKVKLVK